MHTTLFVSVSFYTSNLFVNVQYFEIKSKFNCFDSENVLIIAYSNDDVD